jgi:hypothetical protein
MKIISYKTENKTRQNKTNETKQKETNKTCKSINTCTDSSCYITTVQYLYDMDTVRDTCAVGFHCYREPRYGVITRQMV